MKFYVPQWSQNKLIRAPWSQSKHLRAPLVNRVNFEISRNPVDPELTFTCPHGPKKKFYLPQWPKIAILRAPVITD
jgi:hypothetical protein